ncbi:MAG: signal peptidase I [Planctomycetes bacterium]|nr:signal peptidase I [Planctomycetota bacterium]
MNQTPTKPTARHPLTALELSIISPGLGQVYAGKLLRGLSILFFYAILFPLLVVLCGHFAPSRTASFLPYFFIFFLIYLPVIFDAYFLAKNTRTDYQLKEYNKLTVYLLLLFISLGASASCALFVRGKYVQPFVIPSASMYPNILPGDRILANKIIYDTLDPQIGDLVVFINPENRRQKLIKRVVALPGDTVEFNGDQLIINSAPLSRHPVPESILSSIPAEADGRLLTGEIFYETNGPTQYKINLDQKNPEHIPPLTYNPITIPPYHCFVLGDNRNNSKDSRHFGSIPLATIIGRADHLYFPAQNFSRFGKIN